MNPFKKPSKQISIFTTFGYPSIPDFERQLRLFEEKKIDFIEIGIPFSDPLADGPVIQYTSEVALKNGVNLDQLFSTIGSLKSTIPFVLMGYLNPVLQYGIQRFLKKCKAHEIAGVILPDMSMEIYQRFYKKDFEEQGVHPIFLVTPSTPNDRIKRIVDESANSFVYLVSSNSTTGKENRLKYDTKRFHEIKEICGNTPLFVGFGIKTKDDVRAIQEIADGAIIGSAYLKAVKEKEVHDFLSSITS